MIYCRFLVRKHSSFYPPFLTMVSVCARCSMSDNRIAAYSICLIGFIIGILYIPIEKQEALRDIPEHVQRAAQWWTDKMFTSKDDDSQKEELKSVLGEDNPELQRMNALMRVVRPTPDTKQRDTFQRILEDAVVHSLKAARTVEIAVDYHANDFLSEVMQQAQVQGATGVSLQLPWKTHMYVYRDHIEMYSQSLGISSERFLDK